MARKASPVGRKSLEPKSGQGSTESRPTTKNSRARRTGEGLRGEGHPSSVLDSRVVYCGDNLELPDGFDGMAFQSLTAKYTKYAKSFLEIRSGISRGSRLIHLGALPNSEFFIHPSGNVQAKETIRHKLKDAPMDTRAGFLYCES